MEDHPNDIPISKDQYKTKINGAISQLSIGQLLNTVTDGLCDSSTPECVKADVQGQYNTKIKLNMPKQEQSHSIVFNFPTKNNGTVLQLDPEATKKFLAERLSNTNLSDNGLFSPPIENLSTIGFSQADSKQSTIKSTFLRPTFVKKETGDEAHKIGQPTGSLSNLSKDGGEPIYEDTLWKYRASYGNSGAGCGDNSSISLYDVPTISFDVEEDGQGNKVIGISFPNTNLSQTNGFRGKWRKWLLLLKFAALCVLIVLIVIIVESHLNNDN